MGHLLAVFLRRADDAGFSPPAYPFVALLASGGHTAIYRVDGPRLDAIRELGATRDDAAGEAFDKVAKLLGLGYPGGPMVDKLAAQGDASRAREALPRPMARRDSLEFSFSGIKTAVARHVAVHGVPTGQALADLCAAFQETVVETLVTKTIRRGAARGAALRGARGRGRGEPGAAGADGGRVYAAGRDAGGAAARELHGQRGDDRLCRGRAAGGGGARRDGSGAVDADVAAAGDAEGGRAPLSRGNWRTLR